MTVLDIRPVGETEILISWEDGHRSLYRFDYLRLNCPCASCCDEWSGKRLVTLDQIPKNIKVQDSSWVGRYALRFRWSDGHQTGIYGFEFLRKICPCGSCAGQAEAHQKG